MNRDCVEGSVFSALRTLGGEKPGLEVIHETIHTPLVRVSRQQDKPSLT